MSEITQKDITVIVPVHTWNEEVEKLFKNAIESIPKGVPYIIAHAKGINPMPDYGDSEVTHWLEIEGDNTSFQHMVNEAVKEVKTEWFSILEFDDELSPKWFDNFQKYQKYNQKYKFFLFMNDLYNQEDGKDEFLGNGNEAAWASSFSDEIGIIDEKSVADFFDFYLTGGLFNTEIWNKLGGLKESIKLTFWYEWIMRATHKGENLYVIPKVGYAHVLGRDGSLMMEYRSTIDEKESDFWYKTAKKESYIHPDIEREISYNPKAPVNKEDEETDKPEPPKSLKNKKR